MSRLHCVILSGVCCVVFVTSQWSLANRVGNGGDAIVCRKAGKIVSAALLDFSEKDPGKLNSEKSTWQEIIADVFAPLEEIDPRTFGIFSKQLQKMTSEMDWQEKLALADVKDSQNLLDGDGRDCKLEQSAIRKNTIIVDEKRFILDKNIFMMMSLRDQAGLISHEIIYQYFSQLGEENSLNARKLNSLLFDHAFSRSPLKSQKDTYWKTIRSLKVPIYPR